MAGYSGTPLPQKLGIKPQFRVAFVELPSEVKSELKDSLKSCEVLSDGRSPLDFAMLFVKSRSELKNQCGRIARQLAPAGMLWVSWPKKTSGVATDLMEDEVGKIVLSAGVVDVKVLG